MQPSKPRAGLFTGFGRFGSEAARSVRCRLELPRKMQSGHRISPFAFAPSFLTLRFCHIPLALPSHTARSCGDHPKLRNKHAQPLLSIPNVDDNEFRDAIKVRCLLSLVEDACYRRRHLRRCLLLLHHGTSNSCGLVPSLLCASVRTESASASPHFYCADRDGFLGATNFSIVFYDFTLQRLHWHG